MGRAECEVGREEWKRERGVGEGSGKGERKRVEGRGETGVVK